MVALIGAQLLPGVVFPPRGLPLGKDIEYIGKMFPKLLLGNNPPKPKVLIKINPPHYENLSQRDVSLGKGVLTRGKLKHANILLPLVLLETIPKPLGMFQ
jgi:hypothetical protein